MLLVAAASLLLGGATSFLQTVLPEAVAPFANSASGWTLLTAGAVALCRPRTALAAVLGAVSFVALVLGYQVVSGLRGFPTDETLFLIIGVVVGPFVGVAAAWVRHRDLRGALGCGVLAGIAMGEAAYGLLVVLATTGWSYWTAIGATGLVLLAVTVRRAPRRAAARLPPVGLTIAVAVAFFFSYTAIGSLAL